MRRHRKLLLFGTIALLGIAGVYYLLFDEPEPTYNGRTLSAWLHTTELKPSDGSPMLGDDSLPVLTPEAHRAVSEIGTNAIPFYLKWICDKPTRTELMYFEAISRLPQKWQPRLFSLTRFAYRPDQPRDALSGFKVLGVRASNAIPALTRLMTNYNVRTGKTSKGSFQARFALAYLGKDALPPLLDMLSSASSFDQMNIPLVISRMDYLGTNAQPAVPVLINCTSNGFVQAEAAHALGSLKLDPEHSIPALTNCLSSPDATLRSWSAWSIGQFGSSAISAVPALLPKLNDPMMRNDAYHAIRKILVQNGKLAPWESSAPYDEQIKELRKYWESFTKTNK